MKPALLDHLVCPECGDSLDLDADEWRSAEVYTGTLRCKSKGCRYPIARFVPRFVDADAYADSFSRQRLYVRRHFHHYAVDRSGDQTFLPTTDFDAATIVDGLTLEAGCGYGRYVDVVQRLGGRIVGIDLSTHSIDLAQDFVGLRENVYLAQCDLFKLPFRPGTFQRIFSIGVLHHTPNTRKAFEALVPYLRSDGQISIWVYPPQSKVWVNRWRPLTTRLPASALYGWCIANQVLFSWIRGLPGGWRFSWLIPGTDPGRPFWLRVMTDFDDLSPIYAFTHTPAEVREWFLQADLKDVKLLSRQTAVTGRVS